MADLLSVPAFDPVNIIEATTFSDECLVNATQAKAESDRGFTGNQVARFGEGEQAEIFKIITVTDNQLFIDGNFEYRHERGEKIVQLVGDYVDFYRAANVDGSAPANGAFEFLGTEAIQADDEYVNFLDSEGGADYWYKWIYRNSVNNDTTDLDDARATRGGNVGHYTHVDSIRAEAGFMSNPHLRDLDIFEMLIGAESEVNASLIMGGYSIPLSEPYPDAIMRITTLLGAGMLLTKEYGPEHTGTNKEGERKLAEARALLKKIEGGNMPLITPTNNVLVSSSSPVRAYPDSSVEPAFTMTSKF